MAAINDGGFGTGGTWSYTGACNEWPGYGEFDDTGTAGTIYQTSIGTVSGKVYEVTFDIIRHDTAGSGAYVEVDIGSAASPHFNTVDTFTALLLAGATDTITFTFVGSGTGYDIIHIDNVSIKTARVDLSGDAVAQWKMNDIAATTELNETIANRDGVLQRNASEVTVDGRINTAIDFNGTSDFATVSDNAVFSFGDSADDSPFSIAAWVKVDVIVDDCRTIIAKNTAAGKEWRFYLDNSQLVLRLYDNSTGMIRGQAADDALPDTNWHFVVATYDGRGGNAAYNGVVLYVDGSIVADTVQNSGGTYVAMEDTNADVGIGALNAGGAWYFNGNMDNVMIFDKVLVEAEIDFLYNGGNGTEHLQEVARPVINGSLANADLVGKGLIR